MCSNTRQFRGFDRFDSELEKLFERIGRLPRAFINWSSYLSGVADVSQLIAWSGRWVLRARGSDETIVMRPFCI